MNASHRRVVIRAGGERSFLVEAGSVVVQERPPGERALKIGFEDGNGSWRMAFTNDLPQAKEGEQLSFFVFDDEETKVAIKIVRGTIAVPVKVGP